MKNIHRSLGERFNWYAKWHEHPRHALVHWSVFIIVLFSTGYFFLGQYVFLSNARDNTNSEIFAAENGLHILQEDEFAIFTAGTSESGEVEGFIRLKNGEEIPIKTNGKAVVSVVEYDPETTTYLPNNASGLEIRSLSDFTGYDEDGVDTAIKRKLKKHSEVPVIVRMKLPFKEFYSPNDTENSRSSKAQSFDKAKSSIASSALIKEELKIINGVSVNVNENSLKALSNNPNVDRIDLDREAKAFLDESVGEINAPYVWSLIDNSGNAVTGKGITIAIIDTGVDYTHTDLGGCLGVSCKVIGGYDFVNGDTNPMDDQGHGTHVAATAAGKGLLSGVAPDAKIVAYKVLNSSGSGSFSNIIAAVQRATDPNQDGNSSDHVDVVSMSLGAVCGTYSLSCGPNDAVSTAVNNSVAAGVVHTIAAGNSGPTSSTIGSPGVASGAITVAAACKKSQAGVGNCSTTGAIANFSSRGPVIYNGIDYQKPDISAPGVLICAARWATAFSGSPTCFDSSHIRISGTSMATPHIAGVVALMKQANPTYTPAQIKDRLKDTATSLGRTYNEQGTGEVDLKTAIPIVSKVQSTPDIWKPATNPTQKTSTNTQNFSVTSYDDTISSLTLSFTSPATGITFSSDKETLSVANKGTDTFTGTITVDNDITKAGKYTGVIYLMENNIKKGAITIIIEVLPTLTASATNLDYGLDNPSLSTWTSTTLSTTFTNKRTDKEQVLTVSKSTYPAGITYQTSSSTLTIPASGSASINTSFVVTNSSVPNGTYGGELSLTNSANTLKIPTRFIKYYAIQFEGSAEDIKETVVSVYSQSSTEKYSFVPITKSPQLLLVKSSGVYDVEIKFSSSSCNYYTCGFVIKEGISPNGSIVPIRKSDITRTISIKPTDINGLAMSGLSAYQLNANKLSGTGRSSGNSYMFLGGPLMLNLGMSNTSTNYTFNFIGTNRGNQNPFYHFGGLLTANTGDFNFTNTKEELRTLLIKPSLNIASGASIGMPYVWACIKLNCVVSQAAVTKVSMPFTHTIYSAVNHPDSAASNFTLFYTTYPSNDTTCPVACPHHYISPSFNIKTGLQRDGVLTSVNLPYLLENPMLTGIGPPAFMATFKNTSTLIKLGPSLTSSAQSIYRQDYSKQESLAMPYQISKNGTQVASGTIPEVNQNSHFYDLPTIASFTTGAGTYQFHTAFPYKIMAKDMNADFIASFTTGATDQNPPSIKRLRFYTGASYSEVYDAAQSNKLEMEFYPNTGTISKVETSYSVNGTNYINVQTTNSGEVYTSSIPPVTTEGKITLRIKATDSGANFIQYTFELPTTSFVPEPDTIAPKVDITNPLNDANLLKTVTISTDATDDKGVDHVDFYSGTTLIGATSVAPYSISWDTTGVANGKYSLTAKAYDAAGNVGTSATISVNINNTEELPPDTTLPSSSITEPTSGASLSGSATLTATASDDIGVTKVSFYRGTTLIDTDTTASPTYSITWDTTGVADGPYTLTAKAYDAAGNIGTSSTVNITVANTAPTPDPTPDTTAPKVSITSPTNDGNSFTLPAKGSAKVTATASDASGISSINISINDIKVKSCSLVTTCTFNWNMSQTKNGTYTITATATDKATPANIGTASVTGTK